MSEEISEDERLYNKALKSQNDVRKDDSEILDLDETVSVISHHIEVYYNAYKLPKLKINSAEWDYFYNSIYEVFREKEITSVFYQIMSLYMRSVLSRILLEKREVLTVGVLLDYLETIAELIVYYTPEDMYPEELQKLKEKILKECASTHKVIKTRKSKLVDLSSYRQEKKL